MPHERHGKVNGSAGDGVDVVDVPFDQFGRFHFIHGDQDPLLRGGQSGSAVHGFSRFERVHVGQGGRAPLCQNVAGVAAWWRVVGCCADHLVQALHLRQPGGVELRHGDCRPRIAALGNGSSPVALCILCVLGLPALLDHAGDRSDADACAGRGQDAIVMGGKACRRRKEKSNRSYFTHIAPLR